MTLSVCHINTGVKGGAGIASSRLNKGLRTHSVNSLLLCKSPEDQLMEAEYSLRSRLKEYLFRKLIRPKVFLPAVIDNSESYEIFSSSSSFYRVNLSRYVRKAGIIHLHWISNFIDYKSFFLKIKNKKVVWTLHDLNPFMGGLHYTVDLERTTESLHVVEEKMMECKQKLIKNKGIHFVFLSQWLYQEALKLAPWLANESVHFIENGIDTSIFRFEDQAINKRALNLQEDKKCILFVADSMSVYRKGADIFLESLDEEMVRHHNLEIIAIGRPPLDRKPWIRYVGALASPEEIRRYYSAADLFVLPSRQDNLPNVMLESLCSGCPVLSFKTGGMQEHINAQNGVLCFDMTSDSLREGLLKALSSSFDREKIALEAREKFDIEKSVNKYIELYNAIS